jgi:general secretion pathway protein D
VIFVAYALSMGACQSTQESPASAEARPLPGAPSSPNGQTDRARGAGWQAEKPAGGTVKEPSQATTNLSQPEYYPGSGALVRSGTPAAAPAPQLDDGRISLNFANADIREVINVVLGDALNLNYIVDPRVQGTVVAMNSEPLQRQDVIPALENILALNGVALKLVDGVYHVVPLSEAGHSLSQSRTVLTADQRALGFTITVIPLRFTSAAALHQVASSLVPPDRVFLADSDRNLLIFAGTGSEAEDLVNFARLFDVDWMEGMSYALFPVTVSDAGTLSGELEQIFVRDGTGPLLDLVRFIPIQRMNAILVISQQQSYIEGAGRWIQRLDRGEGSVSRRIHVYYVQNSRAADLAEILSQVFEQGTVESSPALIDVLAPGLRPVELTSPAVESAEPGAEPGAEPAPEPAPEPAAEPSAAQAAIQSHGGSAPALSRNASATVGTLVSESGDVRIIADERNNALVILGTPAEYRMIEATLRRLDIVPLQVLIEATIAEVTLDDELRYGLQWFFQQGDVSGTFSNLGTGAVASQFPGFSLLFDSNDARAVLNALTDVTDINVISSPQLMVLDNQSAVLNVGDQVPVAVQSSVSVTDPDAPVVSSIEYRDTGVTLEITPRVNANGLVVLDIIQEVSDAVPTDTSNLDSPTIQQRRVESTVSVQSGESVALGGLIRDRRVDNVTGVPLLSDIPILGNLFKTTSEEILRTELLILITPRVVRNFGEARAVTEELRARMTGLGALELRLVPAQGSTSTP